MLSEHLIPGQTPLDDLSGLLNRRIRTKTQLDAAEAGNIRKATVKYLSVRPTKRFARFDVAWFFKLHVEMFGDTWTWAGRLRKTELNIGSPVHQLEVDLHNLVADLRAWERSSMPLLEQSARLHHLAVQIHPFQNGNGRWSRMLANIWLMQHGAQPIEWPEKTIGAASEIRDYYLDAVKAADRGDIVPLLALHTQFVRG